MPETVIDAADIKPSVLNLVTIYLAVLIMVPLGKWFFTKVRIPGLSNLSDML
jgi:hypothetical protein